MEAKDNQAVSRILKQYRLSSGEVNYPAVLSVPVSERLPALIQKNFIQATALVVGAITLAFEKLPLKKKTNGVTINDIADDIIDTAGQDNISLEDLMLFLHKLVRGEYGEISEISMQRFVKLFDTYRQERHQALLEYRENEHLQFKGMGFADRSNKTDALSEHFAKLADTMSTLRENVKELKKQNKTTND